MSQEHYRSKFQRIQSGVPEELSSEDIEWMRKRIGWWSDDERKEYLVLWGFLTRVNLDQPMTAEEAKVSDFRNMPDEAVERLGHVNSAPKKESIVDKIRNAVRRK